MNMISSKEVSVPRPSLKVGGPGELTSLPVWAEINLGNICHNLQQVKNLIDPSVKVMAVVKANAYGHGSTVVAKALSNAGIDFFGVARLEEAVVLRNSGIEQPILVFGYTPPESAHILSNYGISQTIYSSSYASKLKKELVKVDGSISGHIKVDTGMRRLGFNSHSTLSHQGVKQFAQSVCRDIEKIYEISNISIDGIYTHLATSDSEDQSLTNLQLKLFAETCEMLKANGHDIPLKHTANSAAVIKFPSAHYDMVRPGLMMYGLKPFDDITHCNVDLKSAMQIKTRVVQVKEVPAGAGISYGHTHHTKNTTRIATIPIGYADGFDRRFSSSGRVIVREQYAPIVGRVCMDQCMIDVGSIDGVEENDEVIILGKQGSVLITEDDFAVQLGTINYEIVSTFMSRVPRIYLEG